MRAFLGIILAMMSLVASALDVGDKIPSFLGKTWADEELDAKDLQGKTLIISFWATWCGPCRKEIPFLEAFERQFGHDKLKVIAINSKEMRRDIKKLIPSIDDLKMTVSRDIKGEVGEAFGVDSYPTLFIVNSEGVINSRHSGYSDESLIATLNEAIELSGSQRKIGQLQH